MFAIISSQPSRPTMGLRWAPCYSRSVYSVCDMFSSCRSLWRYRIAQQRQVTSSPDHTSFISCTIFMYVALCSTLTPSAFIELFRSVLQKQCGHDGLLSKDYEYAPELEDGKWAGQSDCYSGFLKQRVCNSSHLDILMAVKGCSV